MLQDMFGEDSVPKIFKGEKLYVTVNDKRADIDLSNLVRIPASLIRTIYYLTLTLQEVKCVADETFQQIVQTAVTKLYQSLAPPQVDM